MTESGPYRIPKATDPDGYERAKEMCAKLYVGFVGRVEFVGKKIRCYTHG